MDWDEKIQIMTVATLKLREDIMHGHEINENFIIAAGFTDGGKSFPDHLALVRKILNREPDAIKAVEEIERTLIGWQLTECEKTEDGYFVLLRRGYDGDYNASVNASHDEEAIARFLGVLNVHLFMIDDR